MVNGMYLCVCVCVCVCVFQRVLRSAGGWEVRVQVRSRRTGAVLCPAASSAPVVCRTTVWIQITTATVMQTTTSGTALYYSPLCFSALVLMVSLV